MKIIQFFQILIASIKLKLKKHRFMVTPLGDCQMRYIINKYINLSKPDDYIEAYENNICLNEQRAMGISFYRATCMNSNGEINPIKLHFAAAVLSLVILLYAAKNVDDYYALIEHDDDRMMIQKLVNLVG